MNIIKNKFTLIFFVTGMFLLVSISSCKKDFFDVNNNPNYPDDVPLNFLLPSAEAAIAHAVGNDLKIVGGLWAQYWTQGPNSSQYKAYENYAPQVDEFDHLWANLYADALEDLSKIVTKGNALGRTQYVGCAKILQAYTYQVLTDNFGDIPFSEAMQAEDGVIAPHYDSQQKVYDGIIALVNEGISLIDCAQNGKTYSPGSDDLLLGGNLCLWKKFAYTLKLKIYLRLSEVDAGKAQAGIATLPTSSSSFLGTGEEVNFNYVTAGGNSNPLYSVYLDLSSVQNLVASATCVDYMDYNFDPRIDSFYTGASGYAQGDYQSTAAVSLPGAVTGANGSSILSASAPVKLMTGYESLFLQAEAAARGWWSGGNDQALYEAAITENFSSYGINDSLSASDYFTQDTILYPTAGTLADKIRHIITEKWVSMCGNQNDEAWIESRRTNYPDFFTVSVNSIIGDRFPQRLYYPASEASYNGNFPGQKQIYDKMWWDAN